MCGIAYVKMCDGRDANEAIKTIYFKQKERGVKGYGFFNIEKKKYSRCKYEHEILGELHRNKGNEILFHHRKPTSTVNVPQAAQPLCSNENFKDHKYYFAHNGSIENSTYLYRQHTDDKLTYSSVVGVGKLDAPIFNDSESLMFELALIIEGKKDIKDFRAYGSMAFIMLQTDNDGNPLNLYFGRNSKPLKMEITDKRFMIASEPKSKTDVEEGEDIPEDVLHEYNYKTNKITTREMKFPRAYSSAMNNHTMNSYGGFGRRGRMTGVETPQQRASIIENSYSLEDELDDKLSSLSEKSDDELTDLQETFAADIGSADALLMGEHDPEERARIKMEKKQIVEALIKVDEEIDSRINNQADLYDHLPRS